MFIPDDCIGFYKHWDSGEEETFDDLDPVELAKVILGIHYDFHVRNGNDPDGLQILDNILEKLSHYLDEGRWVIMDARKKQDRAFQIHKAKDLVRKQQISLLDAVCLLFTKTELGVYGI